MFLLYILFGVFGISLLVTHYFSTKINYSLSGRIAMSVILMITAYGHFVYVPGMVLMIPDFIPFKIELVYITGVIEFLAAVGLLITSLQRVTAWLLIIFFLLILPANINATLKHIDLFTGNTTGPGVTYLWFRIPMQVLLIVWIYYFGLQLKTKRKSTFTS